MLPPKFFREFYGKINHNYIIPLYLHNVKKRKLCNKNKKYFFIKTKKYFTNQKKRCNILLIYSNCNLEL